MPVKRKKPGPHQDPIPDFSDIRETRSWPETIDGEEWMVSHSFPDVFGIREALMKEPIRNSPVVQSAEDNQRGASRSPLEQTLIKALTPLMRPNNGYEGLTQKDIQAMLYDNEDRAKGAVRYHLTNPGAHEQEMARIQRSQDAISRGDPAAFDGSMEEGMFGYYGEDREGIPGNRTGQVQMGPGAPGWNPNRAQANLLILRTLIEEGYKAGLAAKKGKQPAVQSAEDNQRGR